MTGHRVKNTSYQEQSIQQNKTTVPYYNDLGQQPSNQIHNRHQIAGHFDTKTNVQQNHTYTATTHGVQRRQQQQNEK